MSGMTSIYVCIVSTWYIYIYIYTNRKSHYINCTTLSQHCHVEKNVHMPATPTHRQYNQGIDKICCVLTKVDTVPESEKTEN